MKESVFNYFLIKFTEFFIANKKKFGFNDENVVQIFPLLLRIVKERYDDSYNHQYWVNSPFIWDNVQVFVNDKPVYYTDIFSEFITLYNNGISDYSNNYSEYTKATKIADNLSRISGTVTVGDIIHKIDDVTWKSTKKSSNALTAAEIKKLPYEITHNRIGLSTPYYWEGFTYNSFADAIKQGYWVIYEAHNRQGIVFNYRKCKPTYIPVTDSVILIHNPKFKP